MAKGTSTKSRIKSELWRGFGTGLGIAVFVPLLTMAMSKVGIKL